jgi:hypothetical protein
VTKGTSVTRVQQTTTQTLDAAQLAPFDMVILDWLQRPYTAAEAHAFATWLAAGHGALALAGYAVNYDVGQPNSLMAAVGLSFNPTTVPLLGKVQVTDFTVGDPLTKNVTSVTFYNGSTINDGTPIVAGTHRTWARLNGAPVGMAHEGPQARAVLWGDEWIEFDSEWQTIPDIVQLWINLVNFLSPRCEWQPPR